MSSPLFLDLSVMCKIRLAVLTSPEGSLPSRVNKTKTLLTSQQPAIIGLTKREGFAYAKPNPRWQKMQPKSWQSSHRVEDVHELIERTLADIM